MGKLFDVSLVFSSIPELLTKLPITLELAVVSMLIVQTVNASVMVLPPWVIF